MANAKLIDPCGMRHARLTACPGGLSQMLKDDAYHNFGWLRDVRDYGGAAGRTLAREHIERWCRTHTKWQENLFALTNWAHD